MIRICWIFLAVSWDFTSSLFICFSLLQAKGDGVRGDTKSGITDSWKVGRRVEESDEKEVDIKEVAQKEKDFERCLNIAYLPWPDSR